MEAKGRLYGGRRPTLGGLGAKPPAKWGPIGDPCMDNIVQACSTQVPAELMSAENKCFAELLNHYSTTWAATHCTCATEPWKALCSVNDGHDRLLVQVQEYRNLAKRHTTP